MIDPTPSDPTTERLKAGTLGEYEILGVIGRGGFATVYLAHELSLGRYVAIKVMQPELLDSPDLAERFRQEAVTVANLTHPNIVTIHAVRHSAGLRFQTMEYVRGQSLDRAMREWGPLPFDVVRAIVHQVGSALSHAHSLGVLHRDVKPGNIMLAADGRVVVTDFGIAKFLSEATGLTRTGELIGTPAYMSPEQCSSERLTAASDQYSLGIVAYQMVTGTVPFEGSALSVIRAHVEFAPPPIRGSRPGCPADIEGAIMRMLAKHPADRWPSVGAALTGMQAQPPHVGGPALAAIVALASSPGQEALPSRPLTPRGAAHSPVPESSSNPPATLELVPQPAELSVGERTSVTPRALDAEGRPVSAVVHWHSSEPGIVEVSGMGELTARGSGTAVVTARAGTVTRSFTVVVRAAAAERPSPVTAPPRWLARTGAVAAVAASGVALLVWSPWNEGESLHVVSRVEVIPTGMELTVGDSARLEVEAFDLSGNSFEPAELDLEWTAVAPSIASVSPSGWVGGLEEGDATIRVMASAGNGTPSSAEATIRVVRIATPVASVEIAGPVTMLEGAAQALRPVVRGPDGSVLAGRDVGVTADDATIVAVEGGAIRALRPGSTTVRAAVEGASTEIAVRVVARVAAIRFEPARIQVTEGGVAQLTARVTDRSGQPIIDPKELRWGGGAATVAVVGGASIQPGAYAWEVQGLASGTAELTASVDGTSETVTVEVEAAVVRAARVQIADLPSLNQGDSVRLEADVFDAGGAPLDRVVAWVVLDPGVARLEGNRLHALGAGSARVVAEVDDVADSAAVAVSAPAPAYVRFERFAGGGREVCGVSEARTAYCWGADEEPSLVPDLTVEQVAAGDQHRCAISTSGRVFCWGENAEGQLGVGSNRPVNEPTAIEDRTFTSIAVGAEHTCALTPGGAVYCWGQNRDGQLGSGGNSDEDEPREVRGVEPFAAIAAGDRHTCALERGGRAFCWGDGFAGQVGEGRVQGFNEPHPVAGGHAFRALALGGEHSCGLDESGRVFCWGANESGQIGDGGDADRIEPVAVATDATFDQLFAGGGQTCALTAIGEAWCWGERTDGSPRLLPERLGAGERFRTLAVGRGWVCGVTTRPEAVCWGEGLPGARRADGAVLVQIDR